MAVIDFIRKNGIMETEIKLKDFGKGRMIYENEKEAEMVSGAFEEKTFLLSSDPPADIVSDLFYSVEKYGFRGAARGFSADESDRCAPHHFQKG